MRGGAVGARHRPLRALWPRRADPLWKCDCRPSAGPRVRHPSKDGAAHFPIVLGLREESFVGYQESTRVTGAPLRIFRKILVVEWSVNTGTLTTRPPAASTSSR